MMPVTPSDRVMRRAVAAVFALASVPGFAASAEFPDRPIKFIVPSSPGGSLDLTARQIANKLAGIWSQSVVVENRADTRFVIGPAYVARAEADGYTLLICNISMAVNPGIFSQLPYSPSDFVAVAQVSTMPLGLFVNAEYPARSVQDLLAAMRSQPGKLNHGSGGTATFMQSELLRDLTQADYVDVNYKGASAAMLSTAQGQTQFSFGDMASATAQLNAGRIRQLAVTSVKRSPLLPDVPTMIESGVPGFESSSWVGLFAPKQTPRHVIEKINADVNRVLAMPDVQAWYKAQSIVPQGGTPEEFAKAVRETEEFWGDLARRRSIRLD